jgi:enoyl-CoA hydratase
MMGAPETLIERGGDGIVTVVINRPEKNNALNRPTWIGLTSAFRELSADPSVRCIVLRGAGGKAFSPGADISEFASGRANRAQCEEYAPLIDNTFHAIETCPHPVVALIEGLCVGGGLLLAARCDLRICGRGSRFGAPISRLGMTMAFSELSALIGLVGRAVAMEILLEARILDAAEAERKGLVTRVVPDTEVEAEAYATARRVADGAPLVHRWHKKFIARILSGEPIGDADRAEHFACFGTADYRAGYEAFLAKRKPVFEGR